MAPPTEYEPSFARLAVECGTNSNTYCEAHTSAYCNIVEYR